MGITSLNNPDGNISTISSTEQTTGDGTGDMVKSDYDTNDNGVIDTVELADAGTF